MENTAKLTIRRDDNGKVENIKVQIPISIKSKDSRFTIYSPDLKTFGYSNETEAIAVQDFTIALKVFFKAHIKKGTLDSALDKLGWIGVTSEKSVRKNKSKVPTERIIEEEFAMAA